MAFNTGNPLGSTDPRDFSDNSENLDKAVNNTASATWADRFGNSRTTLAGQIGYIGTGSGGAIESYSAGLVLSTYSTIILYNNEFYRPSASATLPYMTTATTPDVDSNLVAVGDAVLRQDLAGNLSDGEGAALVNGATIYVGSVAELEALSVSIGANVKTLGYYTPGDGGGNEYEIVGGATGVADGGRFINLANGLQAKGLISGVVSVKQFGARGDGATDDTDAFNAATEAAKTYGDYTESVIDLESGNYAVLGTVFIRKGQTLDGRGAKVFMSNTGSFKLGYKGDNTEDPSGHPVFVKDIWLEGGDRPINALISGYTVSNLFVSAPSVGCVFGGTDAVIQNCIFDAGSTLVLFSGRNSHIVNCNFFIGNIQIDLSNARDSVISNCTFNYAANSSIYWEGRTGQACDNVRINNCTFEKNVQDTGTFQGYVSIFNGTNVPVGQLTIADCSFRNCHNAAIKDSGTGSHELNVVDCLFDSNKTFSTYAQSTTMFALDMTSGASGGNVSFRGCKFQNLLDTPIKINSIEAFSFYISDCRFINNSGTESIDFNTSNASSTLTMGNLIGEGKNIVDFSGSGQLYVKGYLKDAWTRLNDGTYDYVIAPVSGATLFDVTFISNPNPGGNTGYRFVEKSIASVSYDFLGGATSTEITNTNVFASRTALGFSPALQVAFNDPSTGDSLAGFVTPAFAVFYWPQGYGFETIDIQYGLSTNS